MKGTTETAQPTERRRTFALKEGVTEGVQLPGRHPVQRELVVLGVGVDARTAELRERIAAASRLNVISSLRLRR